MRFATAADHPEIMEIFAKHRDVFPHVRNDYVDRMIRKGSVVFDHGVVIAFTIYKRRQPIGIDGVIARKGDCILHQIVVDELGSGIATEVFDSFLEYVDTNVYLTVRANNRRAIKFYRREGMQEIGKISWSEGKIHGLIFLLRREYTLYE